MKQILLDALARFTSRKFLVTVGGGAIAVALPEHADLIVKLVAIFVGAEGSRDLAEAISRNRS